MICFRTCDLLEYNTHIYNTGKKLKYDLEFHERRVCTWEEDLKTLRT